MATIQTSMTPEGYRALLMHGQKAFKYYNLWDYSHNYLTSGSENLIFNDTGSHQEITTAKPGLAGYTGIFKTTPSPREIANAVNRVQINFNKTDCNYSFSDQPNVNMKIYVNRWINDLTTGLTYSTSMSESLSLDLIDYVSLNIQQLNTATGVYATSQIIDNPSSMAWKPVSMMDENNLTLLSPRFVKVMGVNTYEMTDNRGGTYPSPFLLSFSTSNINGFMVHGTGIRFTFMPDFGYWVNNNSFVSIQEVETDPTLFKSFIPAARINNNVYILNSSTPYPTANGLIGFALQSFFKTDNSGETLLKGLTDAAILFFKSRGVYDSTNQSYSIQINLTALPTHPQIDFITSKFGGNVTLNFVYENDKTTTNNIIQII